jgi:hypothetical protein
MRLLTIFASESRLLEMLGRQRESLVQTLGRLRGHAEWSVKLLADRRKLERAALERDRKASSTGPGADSPGRAFFARKQSEREVRQKSRELAEGAAAETHDSLRRQAADARVLPAQHPQLSGRAGEMILNAAYLVGRGESDAFTATAEQLRGRYRAIGIELELSGPWAPYNFVADVDKTVKVSEKG